MNYLDYIIFIVLLIGFLLGFKDGLVRKVIGLLGLIIGVVLAYSYSDKVGKYLMNFFNNDEYLAGIIAAILIFLVTILIATIVKRIVHPFDKVNRAINQFLGGVIGAVQILFFLSAVFLFLNIFGIPKGESKNNSFSYFFVQDLIPKSIDLFSSKKFKAVDYFKQYIEKKEIDSSLINEMVPKNK